MADLESRKTQARAWFESLRDRIMTAFSHKTPMTEEQTRAVREEVRKFVAELLARKFRS